MDFAMQMSHKTQINGLEIKFLFDNCGHCVKNRNRILFIKGHLAMEKNETKVRDELHFQDECDLRQ